MSNITIILSWFEFQGLNNVEFFICFSYWIFNDSWTSHFRSAYFKVSRHTGHVKAICIFLCKFPHYINISIIYIHQMCATSQTWLNTNIFQNKMFLFTVSDIKQLWAWSSVKYKLNKVQNSLTFMFFTRGVRNY